MNDVVKKISRKKKFAIIAGGVILVGTLAAYAGAKNSWHGDHMKYMVDHVSDELDLDDSQRAQLESLSTQLTETRSAMRSGEEISSILASVDGTSMDQAALNALITDKIETARSQAPQIIASLAEFYDGLNAEQQAHTRDKLQDMSEHWGSHRRGHEHHE
jgi:protein CpxP